MQYTDLIFVFAFLPITVIAGLFDRSAEYKNMILIISSVIFFTWGRPAIILLLFLTAVMDYLFGLGAASDKKVLKLASLFLDVVMNTGTFVVFSWNSLFRSGGIFDAFEFFSFADKLIPIGTAFYTLRGMSYVFDVFHGRIKPEKNPFCILTYMLSYHFMMAGPVVRYGEISGGIRNRTVGAAEINDGITRFITGLGKAAVVAPAFGKLMTAGLDFSRLTFAGAWLGMAGFLGNVYWMFSGYTDMALGLGLMNGFKYPENILPFRLRGLVTGVVTGFNATLCRFFRLNTINRSKGKFVYGLTVLFSAGCIGLWYGLKKGTVCGALFFGVTVILERAFLARFFKNKPPLLGDVYTVIITLFGASLFYFDSFWKFRNWALTCIGVKSAEFTYSALTSVLKENRIVLAFGLLAFLPPVKKAVKKLCERLSKTDGGYGAVRIVKTVCTLGVLMIYTVEAYNLIK